MTSDHTFSLAGSLLAVALISVGCGGTRAPADPPAEAPTAETVSTAEPETQPVQPLTLADDEPRLWLLETVSCQGEVSIAGDIAIFDPDLADRLFDEAKSEANVFCDIAEDEQSGAGLWDFDMSWSVTAQSSPAGVISLEGGRYEFAGGAHGNFDTYTLIWDRSTGAALSPADLFTSEAAMRSALVEPIRGVIQAEKSARFGYEWTEADIAELLPSDMGWANRVTLLPSSDAEAFGGLKVHFDPYDIGVYAEGSYEAAVSHTAFREALTPDWAEHFSGEMIDPSAIVGDP